MHGVVEKGSGLVGGEAQIGNAELEQLVPRTQAAQGERRVGAGCDDQVDRRRQVIEQVGQPAMDRRLADQVNVVEDEQKPLQRGELVDQEGQHCFTAQRSQRATCRLQHALRTLAQARLDGLQCGDEVGPEAGRVVFPLLKREPGRLQPTVPFGVDPLGEQSRLAVASGGREEDQAVLGAQPLVQAGEQAGARDVVGPQGWDVKLGLEEGDGHGTLDLHRGTQKRLGKAPVIIGSMGGTSKPRAAA